MEQSKDSICRLPHKYLVNRLMTQDKLSQRAMSVQDMEKSLANKARDHRSVSFNGVSVMVDTALKWSMIPKEQQTQLSANE